MLDVEEILEELATGERTLQAICCGRGMVRREYQGLLKLIKRVPEVEERYHAAKRAQFARLRDQALVDVDEVEDPADARQIRRRVELLSRRMPRKIRIVHKRERSPLEEARHRAGLRLNGKRRAPAKGPAP